MLCINSSALARLFRSIGCLLIKRMQLSRARVASLCFFNASFS